MKLPRRTLRGILVACVLTCLFWFLLKLVQGPVFTDGVLFYAPIFVAALVAWRLVVLGKRRSPSYTFLAGAAGGLAGTLVWPMGLLVGMMITGNAGHLFMPSTLLFASFFIASSLGGLISLLMSFGFNPAPGPSQSTPRRNVNALKVTPDAG
jgi:hypothetical protein